MIKKNIDGGKNEINIYESIDNFIQDSKKLYDELTLVYKKNISNENKNTFFKHLTHIQFGFYILPYLTLNDILSLRASSKEINIVINSKICCLNYYFKTLKISNNRNMSKDATKLSNQLRPLEEMNDESEFLEQKKILNNIKAYIKSPEFSLKNLSKIYKVEMDYLKYEASHQIRYMKTLTEIKNNINNEYKQIQNKRINGSNSLEQKENNKEISELEIDELKKKIEELKIKKENILFKLNKEKKLNEDLIKQNMDKNKIINKLKKICLNEENGVDTYESEKDFEIDDLNKI